MSRLMILDGLDAHPSGKKRKGTGKKNRAVANQFAKAAKACKSNKWKRKGHKSYPACVGAEMSGRKPKAKSRGKRK